MNNFFVYDKYREFEWKIKYLNSKLDNLYSQSYIEFYNWTNEDRIRMINETKYEIYGFINELEKISPKSEYNNLDEYIERYHQYESNREFDEIEY
jgi:hypothetical protein